MTPVQAARVIGQRLGMPEGKHPHRSTLRAWGRKWCVRGEHYELLPGGMVFYPAGVEKILAELAGLT